MQRVDLSGMLSLLDGWADYGELLAQLRAGDEAEVLRQPIGLVEAARPFVVAGLHGDLHRPILVIAPGTERAQEYYEQLQTWVSHSERVRLFPAPAHLPYQRVPQDPRVLSQRLSVLSQLYLQKDQALPLIIVTSARALSHRTLPPWDFEAEVMVLKQADRVAMSDLLQAMHRLGYRPTTMVDQPGEFSHRGGIADVFPPADERPLRIEFFGDEIESLRRFDLDSQRSEETVGQVVITPAHEALPLRGPLVASELQGADVSTLHPLAQRDFQQYLEHLAEGDVFPTIGLFQPLLHPEAATLLDYFPEDGCVIVDDWGQLDAISAQLAEQAETQRDDQDASHEIRWPATSSLVRDTEGSSRRRSATPWS